ncbi:MCE family protein [Gordonia alkaliphila]|uniref:MCE family protein n=1 Tax=Gordonia alkaliphila TaxID=1053547 RepID=UPI001FF20D5B|nr:MCE family protein [Gordonia alkaliphila]MCK0439779.1 MCE family protein [Gordonia alkaliphila]
MTVMLPGQPVSRWAYMVRALIAGLLILAFSVWMVARSTGVLSSDPKVYAEIPVSAGLIQTGAPVRYHGVKVGEITSIDAGADSSRIGLTIDEGALDLIPATVVIRVLPRTFFGDIYLQLVQRPGALVQQGKSLTPGAELAVDDGPDAVNLYDIFTKLSDLIAEVEPDQVNVALAAVNRAVGGRGQELGVMIDDWWAASQELESTVHRFLDATPEFRRVAESLRRATPDVIETLNSVTNISRGIVEHDDELAAFFTSALGFVSATGEFIAAERKNLITVLDATGKILATVAEQPSGISTTITEAGKFGAAGTILFATGRFNITAVPTFSEPMPYTGADCPTYGSLRGAQCFGTGSPNGRGAVRAPGEGNSTVLQRKPRNTPAAYTGPEVIDGKAESAAMGRIQSAVAPASASGTPNAATVLMLGPMVRGNQVELS